MKVLESQEALNENDTVMKELRKKTVEVEEVSMKMDEIQHKNNELEILIRKIETYDKEVFERAKSELSL